MKPIEWSFLLCIATILSPSSTYWFFLFRQQKLKNKSNFKFQLKFSKIYISYGDQV